MTADAGLATISQRFASMGLGPGGPGGVPPHVEEELREDGPQDPVALLARSMDTLRGELAASRYRMAARARAFWPIPLPVMAYTVSSGALVAANSFGGTADLAPRDGFFWDITRITVDGLGTNDLVTLYRGGTAAAGQNRLHTFSAAGSSPGPDWTPRKAAVILRTGDALVLVASTSLTATAVIMNGAAVQIEAPWIGEYLA